MPAAATSTMTSDPWATGVLKPEHHDRLVANIAAVSQRAGLGVQHRHLIWTSAELLKAEMQWCMHAINMVRTGEPWPKPQVGLVWTGAQQDCERKMLSMTGLLVRNFVDARCMSRMDVVAERKANGAIDASVVMVPDFATPEYVETMPAWERTAMMEFVHERIRAGLPTCLYVGVSMDLLKQKLPTVHEDLQTSFKIEAA